MSGAIPPFPQYVFMAWCSVKAQGQLYLLPFTLFTWNHLGHLSLWFVLMMLIYWAKIKYLKKVRSSVRDQLKGWSKCKGGGD
jgi:hypothetical protein